METPRVHTVTLGGKTRTLRYEYADLERIEEMLGTSIYDAVTRSATAKARHVLLWAGLKHEEGKRFAPSDVASWCLQIVRDGGDFTDLWPPVRRAIGESGMCGIRFTFDEAGDFVKMEGKDEASQPA